MLSFNLLNVILLILCLASISHADTYSNPIRAVQGSDPFMVYTGGYYYLLTTTWVDVEISRATTLDGLKTATPKVVWSSTVASMCCNVWSPEVHYLDDIWYIYFTAGTDVNLDGQAIHVLIGGATPWDDFTYGGLITNEWAIDGTVLRFTEWGNYLAFSCFNGGSLQSLCVAPLISPTEIGTISIISTPASAWEEEGGSVNEAPAALYYGGATYLTFSASSCWTAYYSLGLLTWNGVTNPAESAAWSKTGPVLSSYDGNYGPGSNGQVPYRYYFNLKIWRPEYRFFTSPDGTQIWNVFNADANSAGACDSTRYTMAEVMEWDGIVPVFSPPLTLGTVLTAPSGE